MEVGLGGGGVPLTAEEARHMEGELTCLVRTCTVVPPCHGLSVGVRQPNEQKPSAPSVLVNGRVQYR